MGFGNTVIKIVANGFGLLLIGYCLYLLIFYVMQRNLLFPLDKLPKGDASLVTKAGGELLKLKFTQGYFELAFLSALNNKESDKPAPVIILAHGNGNIIDDWANRMDFMREQGYAVVLPEYPGYGRSDGKPSYESIKETMGLAYQWVESNPQLDNDNITLVGRSMGGGAVLSLIPQKKPKAIALMSTYSSIADLANSRYLPAFLVLDPFDNVKALSQFSGPTYIVHGEKDLTVPFVSMHKLLAVAKNSQYKVYPGGHNDSPDDWQMYWQDLLKVLAKP